MYFLYPLVGGSGLALARNSFGNKVPPADSHFRKFPRKYACSGRNREQNFPGYARAVALWRPLWCSAAAGEEKLAPNRPVFVKNQRFCVCHSGCRARAPGPILRRFWFGPTSKNFGYLTWTWTVRKICEGVCVEISRLISRKKGRDRGERLSRKT